MLSSVAAQLGGVIEPHYAASKAGLIELTRYYAAAQTKEGIVSNAIASMLILVGRCGQTDEVSLIVVSLATNSYISRQTINVNDGWYMS